MMSDFSFEKIPLAAVQSSSRSREPGCGSGGTLVFRLPAPAWQQSGGNTTEGLAMCFGGEMRVAERWDWGRRNK